MKLQTLALAVLVALAGPALAQTAQDTNKADKAQIKADKDKMRADRKAGEQACEDCADAHRSYHREYYRTKVKPSRAL